MFTSLAFPRSLLSFVVALTAVGAVAAEPSQPIRVGMIGLDAHAVPFTKIITDAKTESPIKDLHVVAAVAAFSPDIPFSADNIEKNTQAMREMGVEIVESIEAMLPKVDAVMLLSIDGRPHLAQAAPVFAARKPVFIDKPVAASLADIVRIFALAQQTGTPCFSNSSLRYSPGIAGMREDPRVGVEASQLHFANPCTDHGRKSAGATGQIEDIVSGTNGGSLDERRGREDELVRPR